MFMSEMGTLIFDWQPDESRYTATCSVQTGKGFSRIILSFQC